MITLLNFNGEVIHSLPTGTIRDVVEDAAKKRISMRRVDLRGADLSGGDYSGADFFGADLAGACFNNANLAGADLGWAGIEDAVFDGANIDGTKFIVPVPVIPDIDRRVYEAVNAENLDMQIWQSTCRTRMCWAGHVVALAGGEGARLKNYVDWPTAAQLILARSGSPIDRRWFHVSNKEALAEISHRAGV